MLVTASVMLLTPTKLAINSMKHLLPPPNSSLLIVLMAALAAVFIKRAEASGKLTLIN